MPHFLFDLNGRIFTFNKEVSRDNHSEDFDYRTMNGDGVHLDNDNTTAVVEADNQAAAENILIVNQYVR